MRRALLLSMLALPLLGRLPAAAQGMESGLAASDAALARLETVTPHLVILDLHLPRVPGTKVLEHIRATPRLAGIKVIIATADSRLADTLHNDADIVLLKPIGFNQLRDLAGRLAK